jgi:cystathionine gamma-lyase
MAVTGFSFTERYGDSTRAVKAVDGEALGGHPVAPVPTPASAFHLSAEEGSESHVYGRYSNPGWDRLESALAQLEAAPAALVFGSGMAAVAVALRVALKPGSVLVVPLDGYYQVRRYARENQVHSHAPKASSGIRASSRWLLHTPRD